MGFMPLNLACFSGSTGVARTLLSHEADVNAASDDGTTPLHEAAGYGSVELVELLLDHGADVNRAGVRGTPLCYAAYSSSPHNQEVIAILKSHGGHY